MSTSDIVIHVPREQLLIVGDVFNKNRLPFISEGTDIDRWIALFQAYLANRDQLRFIVAGHGDLMQPEEIEEQLQYLRDLRECLTEARRTGSTLEEAKQRFSFESRFKHLRHLSHTFPSVPIDFHERNIEMLWKMLVLDIDKA